MERFIDLMPNDGIDDGPAVEEKFIDPEGRHAQGEHVGNPVTDAAEPVVYGGEGVVDHSTLDASNTAEWTKDMLAMWRSESSGVFRTRNLHGHGGAAARAIHTFESRTE